MNGGGVDRKPTLCLMHECMNSIALSVAGLRSCMDVSCLIMYMSKRGGRHTVSQLGGPHIIGVLTYWNSVV